MKSFYFLAASLICASAAAASPPDDKTAAAIRKTVMQYANASGCASVPPTAKMITPFVASNHTDDDTFVVLVNVDSDCHHAKDSWETQMYVLHRPSGTLVSDDPQNLKVTPEMSAPIARRLGGARILTEIYAKNGQLYATGADFKLTDSPCCPSLTSTFKVELQKKMVMFGENDYSNLYRWTLDPVKK